METTPFFFDLTPDEVKEVLTSLGEPAYRANQIWEGFYQKLVKSPLEITSLSKALRAKLTENLAFTHLTEVTRLVSKDKRTVKTLFTLPDGKAVEAVLMRYEERNTLCISSQSGCAMNCVFCATGQMGFGRNLSSGEIVEQVLYYARELAESGQVVTNIVIMGMGEPFHNYDAVLVAIQRLNDPQGFNLGSRRFTISTVGILPGIERFTASKSQINLAVSLHAANDVLRSSLLPANRKYPLANLMAACRNYVEQTHRRITFEWALIQGVNDSDKDAEELAALVAGLLCHVNIIPLNPTQKYAGKTTTQERAAAFQAVLATKGIPCTIRLRRGIEINAGCGQLAATIQPHTPA
jgi:23S rRNA (adenine2503-C2)-methyltransferase